jgi:geranylgeranyl diphosphate synthase type II
MSSASLEEHWQELRKKIEHALEACLDDLPVECPDRLREAMRYSLMADGKRLRPVMTLMACEACGGEIETAMPAACGIEMIHTYSLIHDDLPAMDDDDLRRGRPTNHKQFDEATAILAGDGLLTLAFEVIAKGVQPPEIAAACIADLASAAGSEGMVGGQMADLQAEELALAANSKESGGGPTLDQLEAIHLRKTGRLLRSALTMGARIAQSSDEFVKILDHFGKCVGLAFQITDDLLDIAGDATKMGKAVRKDADHGKLTYPGLLGIEESRRRAEQLIDEACRSIAPLNRGTSLKGVENRGQSLEALARFILERDH